ncbi:MAG: endolytic transglycosylase MltG [Phocaeicola sp.]
MNKKRRNLLITLLTSAVTTLGCMGIILYYDLFISPFQHLETSYIYIDRDDTIDSVRTKIIAVAHPKTMRGFDYLSKYSNYSEQIRTGKYAISPTDNMQKLHRRLLMGYQTPVKVTVPSTRTIDKLIQSVSRQLMLDSVEIAQLITDTAFCTSLGCTEKTVATLFIPNTYEVYWNTTAEKFVERMKKEYNRFWNEKRLAQAKALDLTPEEVMILASIVEEETAYNPEKATIAGLYLNRLKKGMLLQADPTVKFAWQDFALRRILHKHLLIDSPYNTYKYVGLPPSIIRIPSIIGIESVLNYEPHNYLYMCAKEDLSGKHNFATTLKQHSENARKYQRTLNQRKIK